jgi:hypothetical protein
MERIIVNFTADSSGDTLTFLAGGSPASLSLGNISLRQVVEDAVEPNFSVKEFLSGTTDEGNPIFFRADTQQIQLNQNFEMFSTPTTVVNRTQRGTLMKCFVAIDDGDFYEIQGTVNKGFSALKIHSRNKSKIPSPPIAREIRVSWRDSSKQLCCLLQSSIVFVAGTMDYSE